MNVRPSGHRFFLPGCAPAADGTLDLDAIAHQLHHVLRLPPGTEITVLDGSGEAFATRLAALDGRRATGEVTGRRPAQREPEDCPDAASVYAETGPVRMGSAEGNRAGRGALRAGDQRPNGGAPRRQADAQIRTLARHHPRGCRAERPRPSSHAGRTGAVAGRPGSGGGPQAALPGRPAGRRLLRSFAPARNAAGRRPYRSRGRHPAGRRRPPRPQWAGRPVSLGPRTLRAETAAIAATTIILHKTGSLG